METENIVLSEYKTYRISFNSGFDSYHKIAVRDYVRVTKL